MQKTGWKDIAELLGIAAIVASLTFLGFQIQQDRDVALAQIFADHDDTQIEWARLITENNVIWVKGLESQELSKEESATFFAMAGAYFNKEADRYSRGFIISSVPPHTVSTRFAHVIHSYPGLERAWRDQDWVRNDEYHDGTSFGLFVDAVNQLLDEIERGHVEHEEMDNFAPM